jgi:hypothetical protein
VVSTKRVAPCGGVVPPAMPSRRARPRTPWTRQHCEECAANVGRGVLPRARPAIVPGIRRRSWPQFSPAIPAPEAGSRRRLILQRLNREHESDKFVELAAAWAVQSVAESGIEMLRPIRSQLVPMTRGVACAKGRLPDLVPRGRGASTSRPERVPTPASCTRLGTLIEDHSQPSSNRGARWRYWG